MDGKRKSATQGEDDNAPPRKKQANGDEAHRDDGMPWKEGLEVRSRTTQSLSQDDEPTGCLGSSVSCKPSLTSAVDVDVSEGCYLASDE